MGFLKCITLLNASFQNAHKICFSHIQTFKYSKKRGQLLSFYSKCVREVRKIRLRCKSGLSSHLTQHSSHIREVFMYMGISKQNKDKSCSLKWTYSNHSTINAWLQNFNKALLNTHFKLLVYLIYKYIFEAFCLNLNRIEEFDS